VKILIVGNGGREHALLWKLKRDAPDATFYITRGNGGTAALAEALPLAATEVGALADWAAREAVDLTVVGPEIPLAEGIVDEFAARGLPIFGPTRAAAEIESSKAFAKGLMQRHGIPTAEFRVFTDADEAEAYVREKGAPLVVKASGLAAGKGAVVCDSTDEALTAVHEIMAEGSLGEAGRELVIEEMMTGEELSIFALTDGERALILAPSQDHKRVGEGDNGPNTGGMGAYAPVSIATPALLTRIEKEIILPTLAAMAAESRPFRGLLYAGIMLTPSGPKVVEFNCRFGDPETEVVLPLLESSLLEPMLAIARGEGLGRWDEEQLVWRDGAAVTTVLAAPGYPGSYPTGIPIQIPEELIGAEDVIPFHAGTTISDGQLVSNGGRVLVVTGLGPDIATAAERSRLAAQRISAGAFHLRRDIGWREIDRAIRR
jgi:phosphoribosylamine--glycine ligase